MAECYEEEHRFQLGLMDDAAECFVSKREGGGRGERRRGVYALFHGSVAVSVWPTTLIVTLLMAWSC